jgi:hypothetical protein
MTACQGFGDSPSLSKQGFPNRYHPSLKGYNLKDF